MQELMNIQPKGFTFVDMPTTSEESNQMLNFQDITESIFMMHMGDRLADEIHKSGNYIREN